MDSVKQINQNQQQKDDSLNEIEQGKFFKAEDFKQFDLKKLWLGSTEKALQQFDQSYSRFEVQKDLMCKNLKNFQDNEKSYVLSSLMKVQLDEKSIYQQYLKKSRKLIQKLHPKIILNICSYSHQNMFLGLAKIRRVSKIFSYIYKNDRVCQFIAYEYLHLKPQEKGINYQTELQKYCFRYSNFIRTMKYYKQIFYTPQIPQNSFIQDLSQAVSFLNDIHHLVILRNSKQLQYFRIINRFMKKNRIIMGLASLSLTSLVFTRKASIIAFSNYLALNPKQRSRQQITKTKYLKIIQVAQSQVYKSTLIINTKVSMYLKQYHGLDLGIFIDIQNKAHQKFIASNFWDILLFHHYDESKSTLFKNIQFPIQIDTIFPKQLDLNVIQLYFEQGVKKCRLSIMIKNGYEWLVAEMKGKTQITIHGQDQFGSCYLYEGQQYYLMMIPKKNESVEE